MQKINFTPLQLEGIQLMRDFLNNEEEIFTLSGVGGAGKTTILKEVIKDYVGSICAATVSHSAKEVIKNSLGDNIPAFTIAQLLRYKQVITFTGQKTFRPALDKNGEVPIKYYQLIIIDECSMIDNDMYKNILSYKKPSAKIIFLGDEFQLPPVDEFQEQDSLTFSHNAFHLHKAMRYTGPINDLAERLRTEINNVNTGNFATPHVINTWQTQELKNSKRVSKVNEEGSGYIFINDFNQIVNIALNIFKNSTDPNDLKLIAYRNDTLKKLNEVIRANLFANGNIEDLKNLNQFVKDEVIIASEPYSISINGDIETIILNNQMFQVEGLEETIGYAEIPSLYLKLNPKTSFPVKVLDWQKGRHKYFKILNELKANAKNDGSQWPAYYAFIENWAWFNYGYSISAHKSQGRTFKDVIVFERDIFDVSTIKLKAKLQSLYVACTRAKRRVYIFNSVSKVDNSLLPEHLKKELCLM